jgi:hypothetical protein
VKVQIKPDEPPEIEEINVAEVDTTRIFREFGISIPIETYQKPIKFQFKPKERYVRTIPLTWVVQAAGLPGKALHVGVVLWYLSGVKKSCTVKFTPSQTNRFGVNRETSRRALQALEKAQLISVKRSGRKSPIVTILPAPASPKTIAAVENNISNK